MSEYWITTYTGKRFDFIEPSLDAICIEDIAHGLSLKCRFSGQCFSFYSVAQHCVLACELAPIGLKASALLHDAAEAYLPDFPTRLKDISSKILRVEQVVELAITKKFGVKLHNPIIKMIDIRLALTEGKQLLPNLNGWRYLDITEPYPNIHIIPWPPKYAEQRFLKAFRREVKV